MQNGQKLCCTTLEKARKGEQEVLGSETGMRKLYLMGRVAEMARTEKGLKRQETKSEGLGWMAEVLVAYPTHLSLYRSEFVWR